MNNFIARDCIAVALAEVRGISHREASDIINHVLSVCADTLDGETEYDSIASVIEDYLSLGAEWASIFTQD